MAGPLKIVGGPYATVREMLADCNDPQFLAAFDKYQAERRLVTELVALRASIGMTEERLAAKLGWSVAMVEDLESSKDCDLKEADVQLYITACEEEYESLR